MQMNSQGNSFINEYMANTLKMS